MSRSGAVLILVRAAIFALLVDFALWIPWWVLSQGPADVVLIVAFVLLFLVFAMAERAEDYPTVRSPYRSTHASLRRFADRGAMRS